MKLLPAQTTFYNRLPNNTKRRVKINREYQRHSYATKCKDNKFAGYLFWAFQQTQIYLVNDMATEQS